MEYLQEDVIGEPVYYHLVYSGWVNDYYTVRLSNLDLGFHKEIPLGDMSNAQAAQGVTSLSLEMTHHRYGSC
jgi:hypothetical protein